MKTKKLLCALLAVLALISLLPADAQAEGVAIGASVFPDETFRAYVSENFDKDGNGILDDAEIAAVKSINVPKMSISSLKGVEYFTALQNLYCNNNKISSLDLSNNTALQWLVIDSNDLTTLDLTKNTKLSLLSASYNPMTSLKLPRTATLKTLWIERIPSLEFVDISPCSKIAFAYNHAERRTFCDYYIYELDDVKFQINQTATVYSGAEAPVVTSSPADRSVAAGKTTTFKVSAMGAKSYQWYYRTSPSGRWTAVKVGGTSASYKLTAAARHNGYEYRCCVKNDNGVSYSGSALLHINSAKPVISAQPADASVTEGCTAVFTVKAMGGSSYRWYYRSSPTASWKAVKSGGTSASYKLNTAARHNGYEYRCRVTNKAGSVYSGVAKLKVVTKPVITTQPKDVTVRAGKTASFTVAASGEGLIYQWYYLKPGDTTWTAVKKNGCDATYKLKTEARHNGYRYMCIVSNDAGKVFSNEVRLTVK